MNLSAFEIIGLCAAMLVFGFICGYASKFRRRSKLAADMTSPDSRFNSMIPGKPAPEKNFIVTIFKNGSQPSVVPDPDENSDSRTTISDNRFHGSCMICHVPGRSESDAITRAQGIADGLIESGEWA